MAEFELPAGDSLVDARDYYGEQVDFAALQEADVPLDEKLVAPSRLYAYAQRPESIDADIQAVIERALFRHPGQRTLYRRFLEAQALYVLPRARAASSEEVPTRRGEQCVIRAERSRAEADQFIIIIELLDEAQTEPVSLILCDAEDHCQRFALPPAHRGIIQFLASGEDEIVTLLRDPNTEAFLR